MLNEVVEAARPESSSELAAGYCRITVEGDAASSFEMRKNELLLMSAIAQGIDYPHNCRVGSCGRCKTRLLSGRISPMVDFALSPLTNQELKAGYILACQAKVRGDLVIDVKLGNHKMLPTRNLSSKIVRWQKLPGEVIDLRLRLDEPLQFYAGQYCTIAESGSFVRRSYSFYDAPPDPQGSGATEVGFLVKRLPGGKFSEWLFAQDRCGTKIWLEGPLGMMGMEELDRDGLCVAGGTGLAPILSIVADRLVRTLAPKFTIVFGVRASTDVFANQRLQELLAQYPERLRLVTIVSHESADSAWSGRRGWITDALSVDLGVDFKQVATFVCGGLPMVEAVEKKLTALGVPAERIYADKFLPTGY